MENLGMSQKDAYFTSKWRKRIMGQLANSVYLEICPLKRNVCVGVLTVTIQYFAI